MTRITISTESIRRLFFFGFCLFIALLSIPAQELVIELSWDASNFDDFEGGLTLPHRRGAEEEVIRSIMPGTSADGSLKVAPALLGGTAVWTAERLKPGRYGFFVSDLMSIQGLSPLANFGRADLQVTVRTRAGSRVFSAPAKTGAIWQVCEIQGEDGGIIDSGAVLPMKTVVFGYVKDAVTGLPLAGVDIALSHKATGDLVRVKTNADGKYLAQADFGAWTVSMVKNDYISWSDEVAFIKAEYPIRLDAHLSSVMTEAQYRFVLSWGATPADLDAHALGPTPSGGEFHISYRTMKSWERRHFLDKDDTSGYGPETVTLEKLDPGLYVFAVHDYSDLSAKESTRLSYSGATVRVYREAEMIGQASIREGQGGTVWRAFSLDGRTGKLEALDQYLYESDPARVR